MVKHLKFFSIASIVLLLDQIVKFFVRTRLDSEIRFNDFFAITYVKNTGAGFGILQGQTFFLILVSILAVGLIIYYYLKSESGYIIPLALILGGALGNMVDRIFLGFVVDFFNFSFWPAFNIADSALSIGVILIAVNLFKGRSDKTQDGTNEGQ